MRKTEKVISWVVYRMTIRGKPSGMSAVCEQAEWDAMERAQPGYHTLVLAGIANEGEAERLARSGPVGDNEQALRTEAAPTPSVTKGECVR
jgi:hypothetical protein